ncbi:MAG: ATP synthase F0 subunit B [Myxococcales bacterium]|nr:ATP synthase F0 subunit B [Myxococcales bacterium]USN51725.1 MAG: ATP synthase F0 subunit B [Myxococcales bacterium]
MTKNSIIYFLFGLLVEPLVYASETSHGINWWHLGSEYKDAPALGWLTLTFLIFIYAMGRIIQKPLSLYLETRSKDIKRAIEEGQRAKAQSQKQLEEYEHKLKSLSQQIDEMKEHFREQAEAEKKEKIRLAKEVESRIMQDTEDTIRANYVRSKHKLAQEVMELAILGAQKKLSQTQQDEIDQHLKKQLLNDLSTHAREIN